MARITVDDCMERIFNRFELVLVATYRARQVARGHPAKTSEVGKPVVTALREIAEGKVGIEMLFKIPA